MRVRAGRVAAGRRRSSASSPPAADTTAPTAPSNLTASSSTSSSLTMTWTGSTDAVGVTGYTIKQDGATVATTAGATTVTLTGLSPSTSYEVRVAARDAAGNFSTFTASQSFTTAAAAGAVVPLGGPPGATWTLDFQDEFTGSSLDTTKWVAKQDSNPAAMNGVSLAASNVSVSGGEVVLQLSSASVGAMISTDPDEGPTVGYLLPTNAYAEASVYLPGSGANAYNWSAWWVSGDDWSNNGEHDIVETAIGGAVPTVNYHGSPGDYSESGARNNGAPPGTWTNAYHTYGLYRRVGWADVYWDGVLVKSYPTVDLGAGECLLLNVGNGATVVTGASGAIRAQYVRTWVRSGTPTFAPLTDTFPTVAAGVPAGWVQQHIAGSVAVTSAGLALTTPAGSYVPGPGLVWALMEPIADVDVSGDVGWPDLSEQYPNISVRATFPRGDDPRPRDGYSLEFAPGGGSFSIQQNKYGQNASASIGSAAYTYTAGTRVKFRLQSVGPTIRARVWNVGTTEPSTWGISVTNTAIPTPGRVIVSGSSGNAATARTATWDNLAVTAA